MPQPKGSGGKPTTDHNGGAHRNLRWRGLALAIGCLAAIAGPPEARGGIVLGYLGSEAPVVLQSVKANANRLTAVSVGVYALGADGTLQGRLADPELLPFARAHHLRTYACVGNPAPGGDFSAPLAHRAVGPDRARVLAALLALTQDGGYDGLNLDFEGIAPGDRRRYSTFVRLMAARLHAAGKQLVVSVPAKTRDDPADAWTGAFDFQALGRHADLLQLMTYDQHENASEPGPVAGADWVEACVAYAASAVPPAKLLIGLPAYGYDWDRTPGLKGACAYVPWTDFPPLLALPGAEPHWNAAAASPSLTYPRDGHPHEAWLENPASIHAKVAVMQKHHLAGLSVWALGQEDEGFWRAALEPEPATAR